MSSEERRSRMGTGKRADSREPSSAEGHASSRALPNDRRQDRRVRPRGAGRAPDDTRSKEWEVLHLARWVCRRRRRAPAGRNGWRQPAQPRLVLQPVCESRGDRRIGKQTSTMIAAPQTGAARDDYWARILEQYPVFANYERKVTRQFRSSCFGQHPDVEACLPANRQRTVRRTTRGLTGWLDEATNRANHFNRASERTPYSALSTESTRAQGVEHEAQRVAP